MSVEFEKVETVFDARKLTSRTPRYNARNQRETHSRSGISYRYARNIWRAHYKVDPQGIKHRMIVKLIHRAKEITLASPWIDSTIFRPMMCAFKR